jgi:putative ABC transport system permease protein
MNLIDSTRIALHGLRSNLGRSLLTIIGIVIGIVAIVFVMSMGQAAQEFIISQVEGFGAHTLIVRPGREPQGPTGAAETLLSDSLRERDLLFLRQPGRVPGVVSVEPAVLVPGSVSYQNQISRPTVFGWTAEALARFFDVYPETGELFSQEDIEAHAKVGVIGQKVKDELFGDSDAVGEYIKVKGQNIRVVGVLPSKGQVSVLNLDEVVVIPYTTARQDILGSDHYFEFFVGVDEAYDIADVEVDLKAVLRDLHGITDPAKDDFFVVTQKDIIESVSTITSALTIFLVAIASISLLVGGVGIMNIMMVSVTERTAEIGLRKAVGATNKHILQQFLLEALILTTGGGVLGVMLAALLSWVVSLVVRNFFALPWAFTVPLLAVVLGVGMAGFVGVAFGLYPARRASLKDPIEALRYE